MLRTVPAPSQTDSGAAYPGGKAERESIKVCACPGHSRATSSADPAHRLDATGCGIKKTNPLMRNQGNYTRTRICFLKTSLTI